VTSLEQERFAPVTCHSVFCVFRDVFRRGKALAFILEVFCIALACKAAAAESVTITEFVASNSSGLPDENGDYSDWLELFNNGTNTVNLDGWFLTDSPANLTKWRFPATNLAPNRFLIVFASGKNRAVAGAPLHANFQLSAGGEYLALVKPDGATIASEFSPFPEQLANISYGLGQNLQVTSLVSNRSPAWIHVPSNSTLGLTWTTNAFDHSTWGAGTNGVGYENFVSGFAVKKIRANIRLPFMVAEPAVFSAADPVR